MLPRALLALALLVTSAAADSRAWVAARKVAPSGIGVAGGATASKVKGTQLWTMLVHQLTAQWKLDDKKCALESIAFLGRADKPELTVIAFDRKGCIGKLDAKVKWLAPEIAAIAADDEHLAALTAGGFNKDDALAPFIAKISTDAPMWMVMTRSEAVGGGSAKAKAAYGEVTFANPDMNVELHLVVDSEQGATTTAEFSAKRIEEAKKHLPVAMPHALDHITARAHGSEVVIGGPFPERDFASLALTMSLL